jgi:hypothetical protein
MSPLSVQRKKNGTFIKKRKRNEKRTFIKNASQLDTAHPDSEAILKSFAEIFLSVVYPCCC